MDERGKNPPSEVIYNPLQERQKKITEFRQNFGLFLDEKSSNITLVNIPFVKDIQKLIVANFINGVPAPFEYNGLDKELLEVIERYKKSYTPATLLIDTFKLEEFIDMPESLRPFVGSEIKAVSEIHELVSMPKQGASVSEVRYFSSEYEDLPIHELWQAQRYNLDYDTPQDHSKTGFGLLIPTPQIIKVS